MSAITWPRLLTATKGSPICQRLIKLIRAGLPEDKVAWPEELTPYFPYRRHLMETEGVIRCGDRTVIPPDLRPQALDILHAGHAGFTTMLTKATQSLLWPGLRQDIIDIRTHCKDCMYMSPSNPAPPPRSVSTL